MPSGNSSERPAAKRTDFFRLRRDPGTGLEAVRARFHGHAYDMHSHDDEWLAGVTHDGLQDFFCRGQRRQSHPGRVILIEPGERHDGRSPHPEGFAYSMLYLPGHWLQAELGGDAAIGFRATVTDDPLLARAIAEACAAVLDDVPTLAVEAGRDAVLARLRHHLHARTPETPAPDHGLAARAMAYLRAHYAEDVTSADLVAATGAESRFQIARAFSARFGTAPHRQLVQLRLAEARRLLRQGAAPAEVAAACGFADQSHLTRWFRRAYGLPPAAFVRGRSAA